MTTATTRKIEWDTTTTVRTTHAKTVVWDYGDLEREGDGEVVVKRRKRTTH